MNTTLLIKDEKQRKMLESIEDVFGDGTLYSLNYDIDYKLEQLLQFDIDTPVKLLGVFAKLMDLNPFPQSFLAQLGCSCFLCHDENNHVLVGRNYDIKHEMCGMLMTSKDQKDDIPSIALADIGWFNYTKGDLNDGKHDNSLCLLTPYLPVEGINKEGLVIAVLQLIHEGVHQNSGKKKTITTVAIRHALDKAKNVEEAIEVFRSRDMQTSRDGFDYHFFVADKSGRSVVIEYVNNEMRIAETDHVTNFYLCDPENELNVGRERYDVMDAVLRYRGGRLSKKEVLEVLKLISQPSGCDTGRSNTRWSVIYDLTDLSAEIYVDHKYDRPYVVSLKDL